MKNIGSEIVVLEENGITDALQAQVTVLYRQLNAEIRQLDLRRVLRDGRTVVVACFDGDRVAGIAMMAMYTVISGHKGMIEDVVVDQQYRGQGLGRGLMERLLDEAGRHSLGQVLLFSGHHRKTAIALYKSLGFKLKDSGLYTLEPMSGRNAAGSGT